MDTRKRNTGAGMGHSIPKLILRRFRLRYDRERFVLLCLWLAYGVVVMVGCGANNWHPLEPQIETDRLTVVDHWEIGVGVGNTVNGVMR